MVGTGDDASAAGLAVGGGVVNIHEAALAVRAGKKARRKAWPESSRIVRAQDGVIDFVRWERVIRLWVPSLTDLCANDWEIVP